MAENKQLINLFEKLNDYEIHYVFEALKKEFEKQDKSYFEALDYLTQSVDQREFLSQKAKTKLVKEIFNSARKNATGVNKKLLIQNVNSYKQASTILNNSIYWGLKNNNVVVDDYENFNKGVDKIFFNLFKNIKDYTVIFEDNYEQNLQGIFTQIIKDFKTDTNNSVYDNLINLSSKCKTLFKASNQRKIENCLTKINHFKAYVSELLEYSSLSDKTVNLLKSKIEQRDNVDIIKNNSSMFVVSPTNIDFNYALLTGKNLKQALNFAKLDKVYMNNFDKLKVFSDFKLDDNELNLTKILDSRLTTLTINPNSVVEIFNSLNESLNKINATKDQNYLNGLINTGNYHTLHKINNKDIKKNCNNIMSILNCFMEKDQINNYLKNNLSIFTQNSNEIVDSLRKIIQTKSDKTNQEIEKYFDQSFIGDTTTNPSSKTKTSNTKNDNQTINTNNKLKIKLNYNVDNVEQIFNQIENNNEVEILENKKYHTNQQNAQADYELENFIEPMLDMITEIKELNKECNSFIDATSTKDIKALVTAFGKYFKSEQDNSFFKLNVAQYTLENKLMNYEKYIQDKQDKSNFELLQQEIEQVYRLEKSNHLNKIDSAEYMKFYDVQLSKIEQILSRNLIVLSDDKIEQIKQHKTQDQLEFNQLQNKLIQLSKDWTESLQQPWQQCLTAYIQNIEGLSAMENKYHTKYKNLLNQTLKDLQNNKLKLKDFNAKSEYTNYLKDFDILSKNIQAMANELNAVHNEFVKATKNEIKFISSKNAVSLKKEVISLKYRQYIEFRNMTSVITHSNVSQIYPFFCKKYANQYDKQNGVKNNKQLVKNKLNNFNVLSDNDNTMNPLAGEYLKLDLEFFNSTKTEIMELMDQSQDIFDKLAIKQLECTDKYEEEYTENLSKLQILENKFKKEYVSQSNFDDFIKSKNTLIEGRAVTAQMIELINKQKFTRLQDIVDDSKKWQASKNEKTQL